MENAQLIELAFQADQALLDAEGALARFRNRIVDAMGIVAILSNGNLSTASNSLQIAVRDVDLQLQHIRLAMEAVNRHRRTL